MSTPPRPRRVDAHRLATYGTWVALAVAVLVSYLVGLDVLVVAFLAWCGGVVTQVLLFESDRFKRYRPETRQR